MGKKGIILIPEYYNSSSKANERQVLLFEMLEERCGFEIVRANEPEIPSNVEIIITYNIPHYNVQGPMADRLSNLDKKTKLISYMEFYRCYENVLDCEENMTKIFDRSNLILCKVNEDFRRRYPQYVDKVVFFPEFFAPYERYGEFNFSEDPIKQCLMAGSSINSKLYPLRNYILQNHDPLKIRAVHTRAGRGFVRREAYAQLLNSHFCCIATSSCYNIVLAKYFEILAAGSLLLADECEDVKKAGFRPYEHYVPITEDNIFSQVDLVLSSPENFLEIREKGTKFVREDHSIFNRFNQLKKIIEEI